MSSPYDLVVFDWEGTIADTLGMILHVVATEAHLLGFGDFDLNEARSYVDLGLIHALRKAFPYLTLMQQQQLVQAVQNAMHSRPLEVCLMPGVSHLLYHLQEVGINVAVATNKGQHSLTRALQVTGLNEVIKVTRSAGQVPEKPCPQMLIEIMEEFGTTPARTLMIGDSPIDMEMARSVQVTALGMDFYHQQEAALKAAGALAVFDEYKQIEKFLNQE